MGLEDRDWYWKERQRKERLHYDPKAFRRWRGDATQPASRRGRPGFGTIVAILLVVALALAPTIGRWLERWVARGAATTAQATVAIAGAKAAQQDRRRRPIRPTMTSPASISA